MLVLNMCTYDIRTYSTCIKHKYIMQVHLEEIAAQERIREQK